ADVVKDDDLTLGRQSVQKGRIPMVDRPAEPQGENHRNSMAPSEAAVGEPPARHIDVLGRGRRGRRLTHDVRDHSVGHRSLLHVEPTRTVAGMSLVIEPTLHSEFYNATETVWSDVTASRVASSCPPGQRGALASERRSLLLRSSPYR